MFLKCLWIGEPISTPSTFLTVFLWSVFVLVCVLSQMKKLQKRERTCRAYMKVYLCYATMVFTCFCTFSFSFPAIVSQHGPVSFHSHCRHSISLIQCLSSFLEVQYFSGLEIVWLQILCQIHKFYVFVGGLFISFSVSLLLTSCVNIC